jgi:hypothetical protein
MVNATLPGNLTLGNSHGTPFTEIWVGPRAVMNGCGIPRHPPGFKLRTVQAVSEWVKTTGK